MRTRGRLITIEGVDGTGKTTLATGLLDALLARGIDVRLLREPGGAVVSERIRALVRDPGLSIGDRTEALLFAAARAQLCDEVIAPALAAGTWIVLDRFTDSSLAYQGAGRGLGVEPIAMLSAFATAGLAPDRTLLLVLDPATARARAGARGEAADRLEQEDAAFFHRVADGYAQVAQADPERVRVLEATRSPERVLAGALSALDDLLRA